MANEPPKEDTEDGAPDAEFGTGALGNQEFSPVEFNMLVLSLNASALIHLGEATSPETERTDTAPVLDLPMARNAIDMLCMLELKTRGNLSGEEERLLNEVLFDLRMRYAKASSANREAE